MLRSYIIEGEEFWYDTEDIPRKGQQEAEPHILALIFLPILWLLGWY